MAYVSVSEQTQNLFLSGAWYALANIDYGPADHFAAYNYLQSHYNQLGEYSPQVLSSFVTRFEQAAAAAASLRRRPVNPLDVSQIPGSPLLPEQFQYQVVWDFIDVQTGRRYTKLIWVNSNTNLTRNQVLEQAQLQANQYVDQGGARYGPKQGRPVENAGTPGRIAAVLQRSVA